VSFPFPNAKPNKLGYLQSEVDSFVAQAREAYNNHEDGQSLGIREREFTLVKGGYSVSAVDVAMDRLEDSFSARAMALQLSRAGAESLHERANEIRLLLVGRLERPIGKRFDSTGLILRGYSRKQVDAFLVDVSSHIDTRTALSLDEVRKVIFTPKRGGYAENQVDAFIDRVIELLQIEKAL
jgi:DivIVA domain-containing protein